MTTNSKRHEKQVENKFKQKIYIPNMRKLSRISALLLISFQFNETNLFPLNDYPRVSKINYTTPANKFITGRELEHSRRKLSRVHKY